MKRLIFTYVIIIGFLITDNVNSYSFTLPPPTIYPAHCDTLFWSRSIGATSYRLQMFLDSMAMIIVVDTSNITDTFYVVHGLQGSAEFYMRVKARSSTDSSGWSNLTHVILDFGPPPPFVVGVVDTNTSTPTIIWRRVPNALNYRFQLSTDPNFGSTILNFSTSDTCWHIPTGLLNENTIYYYRLSSINSCGISPWSPVYHFTIHINGIKKLSNGIPEKFELFQNYPNPFNPTTKIKFSIPASPVPSKGGGQLVSLQIFDILGKQIASLIPPLWGGQEGLPPGTYEVEFNGSNYPSGVYFYKLKTETFIDTKKLILLK